MIIQIDVDGVLADFMTAYTRQAVKMGFTDTVSGTLDQTVWETYGQVPPDKVGRVWEHIRQSDDFWLKAPALVDKDTFLRLKDLDTARHDVYFVTARIGRRARRQTEQWLWEHGVSTPAVIISNKKGEVAHAISANYAIDDKAGNAIFTGYHSKETKSYIIDRPYNKFDSGVVGGKVRRVRTLDEFLDDVEVGK